MKKIIIINVIFTLFLLLNYSYAKENLANRLSGKILLQVENNGEAWYLNPNNKKRYYMGKPSDAFGLMKNLGLGINDNDLKKIPIGIIEYNDTDTDHDGLVDSLEKAIGTKINNTDSDNDGYSDKEEIQNNYNPLGLGKLEKDNAFIEKNLGRIFLQVEKNGEAWYLNPADKKRYFLNRPTDAFNIMKSLSLGITNKNISKIEVDQLYNTPSTCVNCLIANTPEKTLKEAGISILNNNLESTLNYFTPEMQNSVKFVMNYLDKEGKYTLGNILLGAKLISSSSDEYIYQKEVYFNGEKIPIDFHLKKQGNNNWLITNL